MTAQNGFDRTMSDWLAGENAPDVPEWVYEGAFVEARTMGQSRPMTEALTRWLRPRDILPGPRPQGLGGRSTGAFAPVLLVVALLIVAMVTAVLLVGASRLWPDRLFTTTRFHAVGSITDPGAGLPGTLTALPDGRALVTSGTALDLFDPATGQFVRSKSHLSVPRQYETATLLRDGTVLIVGGGAADRAVSSSGGSVAEIYDPATDTVTSLGPTIHRHDYALAPLLADGRVLIAGSPDLSLRPIAPAELYDPATQTFKGIESTVDAPVTRHRAVLLDDGRVLFVGSGFTDTGFAGSAVLFDPDTEQVNTTGPMAIIQGEATATALSDGRVLLVGGSEWDPGGDAVAISAGPCPSCLRPTDAVQIYDPTTGSFTLAGRMPTPRAGHEAILLEDGDVLVMGGMTKEPGGTLTALTDALRWDHETGEFVPAGSMTRPRSLFLATRLQDGRVLMIGHYPWIAGEGPLPVPTDEELQTVWSAEVFE